MAMQGIYFKGSEIETTKSPTTFKMYVNTYATININTDDKRGHPRPRLRPAR
jgi:hypothetical protein